MAKKVTTHVWVEHPERGAELLEPGDAVPSWAKDQVTNPACFATVDDSDGQAEPDTGPANDSDGDQDQQVDYASWKKDDLVAEVDRRNAQYPEDDQIEVAAPQNKPEYVAALTDDDEREAEDDDPDGDDASE